MSIIALIPARGGSKGIPGKNLARLAHKPLIHYTIDAALNAGSVDRVLVSTDDPMIASTAISLGAEAPFLRPPQLANDTAPMLGVLCHALTWLVSEQIDVDALVLLQPTSPLRNSEHVEEAITLFRTTGASSVVSVVEVPHQFNPTSIMTLGPDGLLPFIENQTVPTRRQDKPKVFARNGPAILVCDPGTILAGQLYGNRCQPYFMSMEDSLDIDAPSDLALAEKALYSRLNK